MAFPLYNADLRFSLTFKKASLKVRFTDLLSSYYAGTYGLTVANLKGIVNVTGSVSGVVYQNVGWPTTSYASPDIVGNTATWYFEFDLPVDVDGEVIPQTFTTEYKLNDGSSTWTISKSYTYNYISPVLTVELTQVCRTALLTSKDDTGTDYLFGTIILGDEDAYGDGALGHDTHPGGECHHHQHAHRHKDHRRHVDTRHLVVERDVADEHLVRTVVQRGGVGEPHVDRHHGHRDGIQDP
jgi:hypothetical protein